MKKILIGILLTMVLIGCGGVKKYSRAEKIDLLIKVIVEDNPKSNTEYFNVERELRKKIENGETKYQAEFNEWAVLYSLILIEDQFGKLDEAKIQELRNVDVNQHLNKTKEKKTNIIDTLKGKNKED